MGTLGQVRVTFLSLLVQVTISLGTGVGRILISIGTGAFGIVVSLETSTVGVVVGIADELIVLTLGLVGNFLGLGLALVDILVVQLHGQGQHGGGALRLRISGGCGSCDLLQASGFGARLDLGDLLAQLGFTLLRFLQLLCKLLNLRGLLLGTLILLLGLCRMLLRELLSLGDLLLSLFKPCIELLDLSRLLLGHHNLLLGGSQLTGQVFGLRTECVALMLHGCQLFAQIRLAGSFSRLCGELVNLCGQTIHLILELFVLSRQSTVAFLSLGKLGCCDLSCLSCLITSAGCLLRGGLQCRVLLLQGLNLSAELGNLGVEPRNIRAEGLSGLAAGDCLLA